MSEVFITPQRGAANPVGRAFISYAHADQEAVRNLIVLPLEAAGVPYFLDEYIPGGAKTIEVLDTAMDKAACAVVGLSPRSLASPWVWFETGVLFGRGKAVIPFVLNPPDKDQLVGELPDFLRQFQLVTSVEKLVESVADAVLDIGPLFGDKALDLEVARRLRRVELELALAIPDDLVPVLDFGFLLVRFGKRAAQEGAEFRTHRLLLNVPLDAEELKASESGGSMRVRYQIPVHDKIGTRFKCFVDVQDLSRIPEVVALLEREGMVGPEPSESGETQRVYFALPLKKHNFVSEGHIVDNYLYPA